MLDIIANNNDKFKKSIWDVRPSSVRHYARFGCYASSRIITFPSPLYIEYEYIRAKGTVITSKIKWRYRAEPVQGSTIIY